MVLIQQRHRDTSTLQKKDFPSETREHPSLHSSGAATQPLGYCPQGAGCRLGHPVQQHNTSFTLTPFHLSAVCTFSATGPIWDAPIIFPGSSSNDVLSAIISIIFKMQVTLTLSCSHIVDSTCCATRRLVGTLSAMLSLV